MWTAGKEDQDFTAWTAAPIQLDKGINIYSSVQDSNVFFISINLKILKSSTSVWHTIWNPICSSQQWEMEMKSAVIGFHRTHIKLVFD